MSLSFRPKLAKNIDQIGDDVSDILNTSLTGFIVGANTPITSSNTVLTALEVVQGQLNAISATEVTSVSGTSNRITASPTTGNVIVDISVSYVGQSSITTLGTIGTGIWNGTAITDSNLASSYLYSNGTRSLTGNWAAGAFYISANQLGAGTGSITPSSMLQVVETSIVVPRGILSDQYNTGTQGSRITMRKARGTFASPLTIVTSDVLASWTAAGYDGSNFIDSSKILVTSIGTIGTGIVPSKMELQTMNAAGTLTTGITIDQAQAVTLASTLNKLTITAPVTSATLTIADGSSLITSGAFGITLTATGTTNITLPTSGTLVGGTGVSGQISYWNGTNSQTGNSNLIYDATNIFVGIGGTPSARLHLQGSISVVAWGVSALGLRSSSATYTDTTSSGSVATLSSVHSLLTPTIAASSVTTYTGRFATLYIESLTAGTNVTFNNNRAIYAVGISEFTTSILVPSIGSTGALTVLSGGSIRTSYTVNGLQVQSTDALSSGTTAQWAITQNGHTGGAQQIMLITAGSLINQTTATEITDINFNLSAVMKMVDGTVVTQRAVRFQGRTYTPQTTALTLTTAVTLDVSPSIAGVGTTITNNFAIRSSGNLCLATAGNGLYIKEGSNATMGTGTLSAGTLVISNTKVTANSEIFLTDKGGGVLANIGTLYISAKSAGVSFTVSSSNALDTSAFSWLIIEPAP